MQITKQQNMQDSKMKKMNVPEMKYLWHEKMRADKNKNERSFEQNQQKVENAVYCLSLFLVSSIKNLCLHFQM